MAKLMCGKKWDTLSCEDLQNEYKYVFEDLTDFLELQNVEPFNTNPGLPFEPLAHQAIVESTEDEMLHKTIKESLREGYKKGNKVLIQELVVVYQYKNRNKGE